MSKGRNEHAPRVLIVAGGTGGHIFPGLAVAEDLLRAGAEVLWLGSGGMESKPVKAVGLPLFVVPFSPRRGGRWRLPLAVWHAYRLLGRICPAVVLGMGGYASVPGALAARLRRLPLIIHEQNAVAGRANRLLRPLAKHVLTGFPAALAGGRQTGTPVRHAFIESAAAARQQSAATNTAAATLNILVLGGSQGARCLNSVIPPGVGEFAGGGKRVTVTHQCGVGNATIVTDAYRNAGISATVLEFIDDVAAVMTAADIVICRAGAATLAELAVVGVAAILVPYPFAAADHQSANARQFAAGGAAVVCDEKNFTPAWLAAQLRRLTAAELTAMAQAAADAATPDAAAAVAGYCLREARHAA